MPDESKTTSTRIDHDERKTRPPYRLSDDKQKAGFKAKYTASCFCGDVKLEIDQDPLQAMYCHCSTCKKLHGGWRRRGRARRLRRAQALRL